MAREAVPGSQQQAEPFRGLLLRYRGRTGMTQKELAARAGVHLRSIQDWEAGISYPRTARLEAVVAAFLEAGGFASGQEQCEAEALWNALEREAPAQRAPFDAAWFADLLASRAAPAAPDTAVAQAGPGCRQDWGEAPDVLGFVGRTDELRTLRQWVLDEDCRLVAILGMGGVGKTSLAAKLARTVADSFERVYWRSLRDAPPPSDWLAGAIGFLSDQQQVSAVAESERLTAVLRLLRERRCLLVLDNVETLFEPGQPVGHYRAGLAGYGRLLQALGEARHQSCLVLTSREAPAELAVLNSRAARTVHLAGLGVDAARVLLASKHLAGTREQWADLNVRFGGNGLALKMVGETIRELFGGDLGSFLAEPCASTAFGSIRRLLAEQIERGSMLEQHVLQVLAVAREPVPLQDVLAALGSRLERGAVLEAVAALRRRSLLELVATPASPAFTLHSVVLEYVTERLVEAVAEEIEGGRPVLLVERSLIQAQTREYARQTQERLIGEPILRRLRAAGGAEGRLLALLDRWRDRPLAEQGYGPGNVINLLRLLRGDLRGLDLSRLTIRQAYLADVEAQDASLRGAHLAETVLGEAFDFPGSAALSGDGRLLAAGTSTGAVHLWRVADRMPLLIVHALTGGVRSVALSDAGQLLASGGTDGVVRLWDTSSGQVLASLEAHASGVFGVALSGDGELLASSGTDGAVRLWDTRSGRLLATLQDCTGVTSTVTLAADGHLVASGGFDGTVRVWETASSRLVSTLRGHRGQVRGVALAADGHLLASGSEDGTVRLWSFDEGMSGRQEARLLTTLRGHRGGVFDVALSATGELLASGGGDGTLRLWQTSSGEPLAILQGHTSTVWNVGLSADGQLLASSGGEGALRLWQTAFTRRERSEPSAERTPELADASAALPSRWRPLATLQGHTGAVRGVALAADGRLLASSAADGTVHVWDTREGRSLAILRGHTGALWSVAFSRDGQLLASGGSDGAVRLWDTLSGRLLASLEAHTGGVPGLALSADGQLLASGGADGALRLWDTHSGRLLATVQEHTGTVWSVALSADGGLLAGDGGNGTVRLWDTGSGQLLASLEGHSGGVRGVALAADGRLVAGGGMEGTVHLWELPSRRLLATLPGHSGGARGVALSADGCLLASGSGDGTVWLWDTRSGRPLATLLGHCGGARGVALSADGHLLASGSLDQTVRLWDTRTGACLHILQAERRYERLDITGLEGITDAQCAALLALGAASRSQPGGRDAAAR